MGMSTWRLTLTFLVAEAILFHGFCDSEQAPYYSFLHEATVAPRIQYYDYIVIGGGTAGCALAATLSKNAMVLLLERGGSPYTNPNATRIENFITTLVDTSPTSMSQQFISEDGVYNARARVLGGGSVLNAGFYTHANPEFVRGAGLDERIVNKSYEWVEKKIVFEPQLLQWQSAVRDGLLEAGVNPYNGFTYDHIKGTKIGGSIFDRNGNRHTAADLLEYALPNNIDVYFHAIVHRILFTQNGTKPRAHGVIYKDSFGLTHIAYLKRNPKNEIILSAGALGSPQLLMLSGIGPANHLKAHGIPIVMDQPMVGEGMSDNPMNLLLIPTLQPVEVSLIEVVGITDFGSYIETASGFSFVYSSAQQFAEDYGLFFNETQDSSMVTPEAMSRAANTIRSLLNGETFSGGVILEKIKGPLSTGTLRLRNTNPDDNPSVTFNYFKDPEDLWRCVLGMKTILNVITTPAFSKFLGRDVSVQDLINLMAILPTNLRQRHMTTALSLEQFCIDTVMTIWHYHGGCQVGKVIDEEYRVLGVDGLRVIDGSTFVSSPGTNPQATVMMLGRYMGRRILYKRLSQSRKKVV